MLTVSLSKLPLRLQDKIFIEPNSGCWLWMGGWTSNGYGMFRDLELKHNVSIHRFVFEFFGGIIPKGLQLDHGCRTRCCCNPLHLEAVTGRINVLRGNTVPGRNIKKTHCIHGHPFDEENTYNRPDGGRYCKACRRVLVRKWRKQQLSER